MFKLVKIIFLLFSIYFVNADYNIDIDASVKISTLDHFWESTGFCPPEPHQSAAKYFLSDDMKQNFLHIGSVPHQGIKQVRMHWMLDLVTFDSKTQTYNFTYLDRLLDFMKTCNLKPGFELMGNPSNIFTNFEDKDQVFAWMNLISQIGKRYIKLFGLNWVKSWNFETWNEPDHKDFDVINMTVQGFLNYYDACSEGLKAADRSLIFGGPGASCRKPSFSKRCYALLQHSINGTNYITKKVGNRIDFISFHKKGKGMARYLLQDEITTMDVINKNYSQLMNVSIFNDEADPLVGWSKPLEWRADVTYAAVVAKIIAQHQNFLISNPAFKNNYTLLGNDNGFLSFYPNQFTQRTLNARFQMNNTKPHYVRLVKKPVISVMLLLSKLGNEQIKHKVLGNPDEVGTIASSCEPPYCNSKETVLIVYNSKDTSTYKGYSNINVAIKNLVQESANDTMVMSCVIDIIESNPYALWRSLKAPDYPTLSEFAEMDRLSYPKCHNPAALKTTGQSAYFNFTLSLPGVSLHQICWKPLNAPLTPFDVQMHNVTTGVGLLTWKYPLDSTKCIKTFQVLFQKTKSEERKILNTYDILFQSYTVSSENGKISGIYYIVCLDFWNRQSKLSKPLIVLSDD